MKDSSKHRKSSEKDVLVMLWHKGVKSLISATSPGTFAINWSTLEALPLGEVVTKGGEPSMAVRICAIREFGISMFKILESVV